MLEEGHGLNLTRAPEVTSKCEKIKTQLAALSVKGEESESINGINERSNNPSTTSQGRFQGRDKICYRCGLLEHFGRDPQCPARGKTCRKCREKDDFGKSLQDKVIRLSGWEGTR